MDTNKCVDMLQISVEEYRQLVEDSIFLSCLQSAGVDNWDGYSEALQILIESTVDEGSI